MKRRIAFLLAVLMCCGLLLSALVPAAVAADDPAIPEQAMSKAQAALDAAKQAAAEQGVEIDFDHPQQAIADGEPTPEERAQLIEAANAAKSGYENAVKTAQAAGLEIDSDGYAHLPEELDEQADLMQLNALIQVIKAAKAAWDAAIKQAEALGVEIVYDEDYGPAPARPDDSEDPSEPIVDPAEPDPDPFRFDDVKDDKAFYFAPVYWAVEQKITRGTSEKLFSPDDGCTRAQAVTFLWRAAGEPEPTKSENPFRDVKGTDYFRKAVLWAVEQGITKGTGEGTFSPDATCTRAQIVTFLYRCAFRGSDIPASEETPRSFPDVPTDAYYAVPVVWALNTAITRGTSPTTFSPDATCTRGEIVTFLYRANAE